ncbi:MAG: cyclic nucleotide-binding domain-containing protein [Thermodesulfovibrionales bacterium]|nr:cyclic nucleotide-binding domain-containing protein [Thermodesulfovibrionales bacterium]
MSLKDIPIFEGLSDDVFEIFMPFVREEAYGAGSLIFKEGSSADKFFIIKDGDVEIRKVIDGHEHGYKLISVLTKGDFFGEMAIFQGLPRTADAYAKTAVSLLAVSKDDMAGLFKPKDPAFKAMGFLASVLMQRLRSTTKELAAVYETGMLITSARSVSGLSNYVMESVFKAVDTAEAGLFAVWNEFNGEFEVSYQRGFDFGPDLSIESNDALIVWLEENREAFLSFDLEGDQRLQIAKDGMYKGLSMVAAPFFSEDRLTGLMLLLSRTGRNAFSYEQMVLMSAIAGYVSVALENLKHLQDEIDRYRLSRMKSGMHP